MQCGAPTLSGGTCRQTLKEGQERCWQHNGPQCSVCLTNMNAHSQKRKLGCDHEFHLKCLNRWKASCTGPDPTCPMCRVPFDVPSYRCRLIIERTEDSTVSVNNFSTSNILPITEGFGLDFRQIIPPGNTRFYTDIHFDINPGEDLMDVLGGLGLR